MAQRLQVADICHRYKTGQSHVVQWLTDTAVRHGCLTLSTSSWDSYLAQKVEEQHKKDWWSLQLITLAPVVPLSTVQLVTVSKQLADVVHVDKQSLFGFEDTLLLLEDVIRSRRECAQYYVHESKRCDAARQSYDSHMEFVSSLTDVLGHLRRLHRPQTKKASRKGRAVRSKLIQAQQTSNAYQVLPVEELEDLAHDIALADPPKHMPGASKYKPQENSLGSVEADIWDLLKECHNIRQCVKATWERQVSGKLTSTVAAQTTDHAFWLIRSVFQDFLKKHPGLMDFGSISDHLGVEVLFSGNNVQDIQCKGPPGSAHDTFDVTLSELLCTKALTGLSMIRGAVRSEEKQHGLDLTDAAAVHPLFHHFLTGLFELIALTEEHEKLEALGFNDTFMQWMVAFGVGMPDTMPFAWVQAFQMHMDIYDVQEGRAIQECVSLRSYAEIVGQAHLRFDKTAFTLPHAIMLSPEFLRSPQRDVVKSTLAALDTPYRNKMAAERTTPLGDTYQHEVASRLFMRFPTVAGNAIRHLAESYHAEGIAMCNLDSTILCIAHLYTACRVSGVLKKSWKDLDFLIGQQGNSTLGLIDAGVSRNKMLHAAKYFGFALGVDPKEYLKRQRRPQTQSSWTRAALPRNLRRMKKLEVKSILGSALQRFGVANTPLACAQPQALRLVLEHISIEAHGYHDRASYPGAGGLPSPSGDLTSVQILSLVQKVLLDEELQLHFDYLSFLNFAYQVLSLLPAQCAERVPYAAERVEDKMPHELVDFILWDAAEREEGSLPQTLLSYVGLVFEAVIKLGSDTHLRVAKLWTSEGSDDTTLRKKKPASRIEEIEMIKGPKMHLKNGKIVSVERLSEDAPVE